MRRLAGGREHIDGPLDRAVLAGNLRDMARINRALGGAALSWRAVEPILDEHSTRPLRLLDVGTGGLDIPLYLQRTAVRRNRKLDITATDVRPEIVEIGQQMAQGQAIRVRLARPDGLDESDDSFDVVHSSMVIHHLEPSEAVTMLREMSRVARRAVIVNDLDRSRLWHVLAYALSRVATRNRYTRHDAPMSVRRAYRPAELAMLAAEAGLAAEATYWARPAYRFATVFRHA